MTYWYKSFTSCEELAPIFHNVEFAKRGICGSTHDNCFGIAISRVKALLTVKDLDARAYRRIILTHLAYIANGKKNVLYCATISLGE